MPTIYDGARPAQWRQPFARMPHRMRPGLFRLALLLVVGAAAYLPAVLAAPASPANARSVPSAAVAMHSLVQCAGLSLPC